MTVSKLLMAAAALVALAACSQQDQAAQPSINQSRITVPARVSGAQAKAVMHERKDGMEKVGKTMKLLSREIKSGAPDMAAVKSAAAAMNDLARRSATWFPAGTGPNVGKTRAKAEIWQKPQDFAAKQKAFQTAAVAFKAAAQGGNASAAAASFAELGKTCKACHDSYRKEMKH